MPRMSLRSFGSFQCSLEDVGDRRVCSCASWGRRILSVAPWGSLGSLGSVPVRHEVHSDVFGPFACALCFFGFVWVLSFHSRAPLELSGSFACVRYALEIVGVVRDLPMFPGALRVRLGAFGRFSAPRG